MEDQNQPDSTPKQPRVFLSAPNQSESQNTQQGLRPTALQASQYQQPPTPPSTTPKKVIQPSDSFVEEVQAARETSQTTTSSEEPAQPLDTPSTYPGLTTSTGQVSSQASVDESVPVEAEPTRPDPSAIYPEATSGISGNDTSYSAPAPNDNEKSILNTVTFAEGYVIGKTIFFYELIAGIVIGLLTPRITHTFSHTPLVLAILYVIEYLVVLYLPYRVLQSEAVQEPLWLTFIGTAVQAVIIAVGFALMDIIVKTVGSLGIFEIAIGVGFLVASYFLTKLAWGMAFSFVSKIKYKPLIKIIGIGLMAITIGTIAYHFVLQQRTGIKSSATTSATSIQSVGLTKYNVTGSPSFSLSFYKGSKEMAGYNGSGDLSYNAGPGVNGVSISVAIGPPINAQTPTYCYASGIKNQFNFSSQGSTGFVCTSRTNNLTTYTGHIQEHDKNYTINMFAWSQQQKPAIVKAIFNSIVIE